MDRIASKRIAVKVDAVFYGDDALNLTLYDLTPNGTKYALCTTLQYSDYKPASNSYTVCSADSVED
jgi:hypothetical protein